MLFYALGWGLVAYFVMRVAAAIAPPVIHDRLAVAAIYAASATTIAKLLGL